MSRRAPADMNESALLPGRFSEKEALRGLNVRLAGFMELVHRLQLHHHRLQREIRDIRGRERPASGLEREFGPELGELRQLLRDMTHQKHLLTIERQNLEDDVRSVRGKHGEEAQRRSDAERNVEVLKRDISDAFKVNLQLDKKAQALLDEIHLLNRKHQADVSQMCGRIQAAQLAVSAPGCSCTGVTAALRDIRTLELEVPASAAVQNMDRTFRSQCDKLTEEAEKEREAFKATHGEIQEHRRSLQAKDMELDCAQRTREALEKQLHLMEDHHREESTHYQNMIEDLEKELLNCKFDLSGYLREHQDLLNIKMALDEEITSYRKLLNNEETPATTTTDPHISFPYIYHQSPVYTLPCLSRPGGRWAQPQYKFVEEIITETTREIEMLDFEETESEQTKMSDMRACVTEEIEEEIIKSVMEQGEHISQVRDECSESAEIEAADKDSESINFKMTIEAQLI